MQLKEIPCSEHVALTDEPKKIRDALISIDGALAMDGPGKRFFNSSAPIEGAPCSGRILFTTQQKCGIKLPTPMTPFEMSLEIMRLAGEARYLPIPDRWKATRGWEIRAAIMQSAPVVIIWAAWIRPELSL